MAKDLRFKKGQLVIVRDTFRIIGSGSWSFGPRVKEKLTAVCEQLVPGMSYLALTDSIESTSQNNRRLWMEILTPDGPRVVWSSAFKMRNRDNEI